MQFPELEYNLPVKRINISDEISIGYVDEGEGDETILFIHGLASYIPAWYKNISTLKNKFRCIAIDLPGYGKSSSGVFPGKINFYADVISSFIEKMQLKNVVLAGHSMGGHICIQTTLSYPHLVKKLILLASAGIEEFNDEQIKQIKLVNIVEAFANSDEAKIRLSFYANFFNPPADMEFMIQDRLNMRMWTNFLSYCQVVVNSVNGLLDEPVTDKLHLLKLPVLLLFGKNDRFIPNQYVQKKLTVEDVAQIAKERIPHAEIILLENCGHFIQWEKSDSVNQLIERFV